MRTGLRWRQTKTGAGTFTKVFPTVTKSLIRNAILQELRAELSRQTEAANVARDEAISEESRAENKWDTHSQEAAYLAEGQARLAADIGASIELYETLPLPDAAPGDAIAIGAVVELASVTGESSYYFLGPRAGGMEIEAGGRRLLVLTPQSPLGRQLLGRRAGDTIEVPGRGAKPVQRIVSVQ